MSILSNNRFLQRVNPEIVRARTDAGASLVSDHAVIQPLMRQMVDLGIADNLKLWVHSGLVNTRTSGSDLFVPKAYDISGEENDAAQTTPANQPKLVDHGFELTSANSHNLQITNADSLNSSAATIILWAYPASIVTFPRLVSHFDATNSARQRFDIYHHSNNNQIRFRFGDTNGVLNDNNFFDISQVNYLQNWHHLAVTIDTRVIIYHNGQEVHNEAIAHGIDSISTAPTPLMIGGYINFARFFNGTINDVRYLDSVISATQITSIYNATKGYYGIT